jgi:ribosomal-protein-alanine N-acetyltransferase
MPIPVIYSDHLVLRPCEATDIEALYQLWVDPDVRRYLFDDVVISFEQASEIVRSSIDTFAALGLGIWVIHCHENGPFIGFCGFRLADGTHELELLYGLSPAYWGQGIATEACLAALSYLWSTNASTRVYARTDPPNRKSVAVMERLGMCCLETQRGAHGQPLVTYAIDRPKHLLS